MTYVSDKKKAVEKTKRVLADAMEDRALPILVKEAKRLVRKPYPPASRPGEPPRKRTGALLNDIRQGRVRILKTRVTGEYGVDSPVGKFLELGTSRMAPRPFLRPSFARKRRAVERVFRNVLDRAGLL